MKREKNRLGIIYSTNPDFVYETNEPQEYDTLPNNEQNLRIRLEKNHRGGKTVSIVTGFFGRSEDLENLGKILKQKCGVGGTVKDNEIIIQGDQRDKILQYLLANQYKAKKI